MNPNNKTAPTNQMLDCYYSGKKTKFLNMRKHDKFTLCEIKYTEEKQDER